MSTRWYPLYQKGNPQLRVFLPNFWMKLVKPKKDMPKNIVQFHCSMEMTRFDVKNYLEKIYNVHPVQVNIKIAAGKTRQPTSFVIKDDDTKVAYVTLPKTESFTFPNMFTEKKEELTTREEKYKEVNQNFKNFTKNNKMPSFPTWFSM